MHEPRPHTPDATAASTATTPATRTADFAQRLRLARERTGLSDAELGIARVYAQPVTADDAPTDHAAPSSPSTLTSSPNMHWDLHGYEVLIKDLSQVAGQEVGLGSEHQRFLATRTDTTAQCLLDAGATLVGASAAAEFGTTAYTEPVGSAAPINPIGLKFMAGGSSGGAAVAVARGLVDVAHASDGGGSIRIPAACCGLIGLKPAHDRLVGGFTPVAEGFLAKDLATTARVYGLAEPDPAGADLDGSAANPTSGLRLGYTNTPFHSGSTVDPRIAATTASAAALLTTRPQVQSIAQAPAPYPRSTFDLFTDQMAIRCADLPGKLTPISAWLRDRGKGLAAAAGTDPDANITALRQIAEQVEEAWADFDIIATPTLACAPPPPGTFSALAPRLNFLAQTAWTPWGTLWNIAGWASVSVPLITPDQSHGRWPISLMLGAVGNRVSEAQLLELAGVVQETVASTFGGDPASVAEQFSVGEAGDIESLGWRPTPDSGHSHSHH